MFSCALFGHYFVYVSLISSYVGCLESEISITFLTLGWAVVNHLHYTNVPEATVPTLTTFFQNNLHTGIYDTNPTNFTLPTLFSECTATASTGSC